MSTKDYIENNQERKRCREFPYKFLIQGYNMKKKYDVIVIDSGVCKSHDVFKGAKINGFSLNISESGNMYVDENFEDRIGHGTAVYYILSKKTRLEDILMIKIFDEREAVNFELFCSALDYIYQNYECKILHLSVGVCICEDIKMLHDICLKLTKKNIIIIAAFDNGGAISYPASFDFVIGVDWSLDCTRVGQFEFVENSPINIRAIGSEQRVPWLENEFNFVNGSSFSTPHITNLVIEIIRKGFNSYEDIMDQLRLSAKKIYKKQKDLIENVKFNIKSAVAFPFNKEIHSLISFQDLLSFDLYDIYDIRELGNINKLTSDISFLQSSKEYKIKSFNKINWNEGFDTFILGHVRELSAIKQIDLIEEVIKKCIEYKKNLYAFDDLSSYQELLIELKSKNLKVFYPRFTTGMVPQNRFGKLYKFGVPIVSIMGTSSRQGKFTLQLYLRRLFLENGYNIGQLSTEPSGLLFDFDEMVCIGYDTNIEINSYQSILAMNQMIHKIEKNSPEIIILGSQSNTIHPMTGNLGFYPIRNHELLLASEPDIVILCVNLLDSIEYIKRTKSFIENYQFTKVHSIVIFPRKKELKWSTLGIRKDIELTELILDYKNKLQTVFNLSVCILGYGDDMIDLYESIVDYFSNIDNV